MSLVATRKLYVSSLSNTTITSALIGVSLALVVTSSPTLAAPARPRLDLFRVGAETDSAVSRRAGRPGEVARRPGNPHAERGDAMSIVAIADTLGSRGDEIGRELARRLGWEF